MYRAPRKDSNADLFGWKAETIKEDLEMPKKSKQTIEDEETIAMAKAIAFDLTRPDYIRTKALGTYSAMRQRMERLKAVKAAAAASRREKAKADQPVFSWIPERGEGEENYRARMARQKALASAD
jgi:hypothetical protein